MNRRPAASKPRDRGAVAVEFALLLPVLLLLLFGIVDFGRLLNAQIVITQAAREGSRLQALGVPAATVVTKTQAAAVELPLPLPTVNTGTVCPANAGASVDAVVIVTYTFTFLTPVGAIGRMFGSNNYGTTLTLTAQGEMPCET
jgi:Flp pilus assembly protein TadG